MIVAEGAIRITRPEAIVRANENVVFSRSGKVEGITLDDYRHAQAQPVPAGPAWLHVDPKLTDYESGRVQFGPTSPAAGLRLPALDVSTAGATGTTP